MKLHLPKSLFVAVLAACVAQPVGATITTDSVNKTYTVTGGTSADGNNNIVPPSDADYKLIFKITATGTDDRNYFDDKNGANDRDWIANGSVQIGELGAAADDSQGMIITNGNGNQDSVFAGKVTGTGILKRTGNGSTTLTFSGDATEYKGNIYLGGSTSNTFTLTFGGQTEAVAATSNNSSTAGVSGTGNITIASATNKLVYNYSKNTGGTPVYITNAIAEADNINSSVVTLKGGADYVFTKTVSVDQVKLEDGSLTLGAYGNNVTSAIEVSDGAKLYVSGDNADTNGDLVVNTTGAGDIVLTAAAKLNNGDASRATGDLRIQNATLTIGNYYDGSGFKGHSFNLTSFTSWTLDKGTIQYHGANVRLNDLTVTSNGGEIKLFDMNGQDGACDTFTLAGTTTLNGELKINTTNWKSTTSIENLKGGGNLSIVSSTSTGNDPTVVNIQGMSNYYGDITVTKKTASATLNLSGMLNAGTAENATTITAVNGATINVGAAGVTTTLSGNIEFASAINLNSILNISDGAKVSFNGQTITLKGSSWFTRPILPVTLLTKNGVQSLSYGYVIATGNVGGISGQVQLSGTQGMKDVVDGGIGIRDNNNYYVIAENNTAYDKTDHNGISNFGGYVVTNGATFDLNLQDDKAGFQPHLYLDAGSTITNNNVDLGTGKVAILNVTLLGDATVDAKANHQFGMLSNGWSESTLALDGHTLTKKGDGIFHLVNTTVSNGTIDVTEGTLLVESRTDYHNNGTVFNNATVNVGEDGTLQINSMKDEATVGTVLASTTGDGRIVLATNAQLKGNGDGTGQSMIATGTLAVNSGATLKIGNSDKQVNDVSELHSIELNGGSLYYQNKGGVINNLTVTNLGGSIEVYDLGNTADAVLLFDKTTSLSGNLKMTNAWGHKITFSKLSGAGNLVLDDGSRSDNVTLTINGVEDFTGKVQIAQSATNMTLNVAEDLGLGIEYGFMSGSTKRTANGHADLSAIKAGNTVSFNSFSGYVTGGEGGVVAADIVLTGNDDVAAINWTDGSKSANLVFDGKVSGSRNIAFGQGKGHNVEFTGDVSDYQGTIWGSVTGDNGNSGTSITYSGDATEINHTVASGRVDEYSPTGVTDVTYKYSKNMAVNGGINKDAGWAGTVNIKVVNDSAAENSKVTFNGDVSGKNTVNIGANAVAEFTSSNVAVSDILVQAAAQLSFTAKDSLSVSKLEMQEGAEVSVSKEGAVGTLTVEKSATFNGGNVNANLTLANNATVTINDAVALGSASNVAPVSATETAYTLSLGTQLTLQGNILEQFDASAPGSGEVILFKGVDTLNLGGVDYNALSAADGVKLSTYFSSGSDSVNFNDYYIGFNANGDVYAGLIVPEPTTATLSLLALAGLCARRRRASR